jgi:hypothetical protein
MENLIKGLEVRVDRLKRTVKLAEDNGLSLVLNEDSARLDETECLLDLIKRNGVTVYEKVEASGQRSLHLTKESAEEGLGYTGFIREIKVMP